MATARIPAINRRAPTRAEARVAGAMRRDLARLSRVSGRGATRASGGSDRS